MEYKDTIKDLSVLTGLSVVSIQRVLSKFEDIIVHNISECYNSNEDVCNLDIGIGNLNILISEDELMYRFTPSSRLEKNIVRTVSENKDVLLEKLESSLTEKIVNTYKDLF